MEIELTKCTVTEDEIEIISKFTATFREFESQGLGSYKYDGVLAQCKTSIADVVSREYLVAHKMEIVNEISQKELVDAIQLKIIEGFSIGRT